MQLADLLSTAKPYVLCIVTSAQGEVPGKPGFKMTVRPDGMVRGTVGGGDIERRVIELARNMLQEGGDHRVETFDLGGARPDATVQTSMQCGGGATVYFERIEAPLRALIFGGGHIGQELAPLLARSGFAVQVLDDRPDYATAERYPADASLHIGPYSELAQDVELGDAPYCAILTHGHVHDETVLKGLLERAAAGHKLGYVGMIGSRRKVKIILDRLANGGLPRALVDSVYTPIGLAIGGNSPFEIAVSICAEIQALRYGCTAPHMGSAAEI